MAIYLILMLDVQICDQISLCIAAGDLLRAMVSYGDQSFQHASGNALEMGSWLFSLD